MHVEANGRFVRNQAKQKPDLLLPDAQRFLVAADIPFGQSVAQPTLSPAETPDVIRVQPQFFVQLAVHRRFRGFLLADPSLRELPCVLADAFCDQQAPLIICDDDPHVGTEAVCIDHGGLPLLFFFDCILTENAHGRQLGTFRSGQYPAAR